MNNEKDKELDDFFRKGLRDPVDPVYRENDWSSLEQMLEKSKKPRGMVYWLPYISSAAALLLLFLGWWSFRPKSTPQSQPQVAMRPSKGQSTITPTQQPPMHPQNRVQLVQQGEIAKIASSGHNSRVNPTSGREDHSGLFNIGSNNTGETNANKQFAARSRMNTGPVGEGGLNREFAMLTSANLKPAFEDELVNQPVISSHDLANRKGAGLQGGVKPSNKTKIASQGAFHPQYALTVLAAPDLNGVGSFQQGKIGTNAGLQFSAGLSRKFTITTGIIYSAKPYLTDFDSYHTLYKFPVTPVNVTADCRMLDIPLNVGYQVYNKHQNKISIGTGLSSYLMLHENYTFNYAVSTHPYGYGYTSPTSYTVPHSKSYLMGVMNLNATYERPLNSKISIAVEPYLKLPLTNIGYSQVRLQSTGVAVGLKWNLNSSAKP